MWWCYRTTGAELDLPQLRTVVAIAESGSITRASERLHLSQPAVSAQLKRLEDELELRLFRRTARGMVPTPEGEQLLPTVRTLLAQADGLMGQAARLAGRTHGTLRIGTIDCGYDLSIPRLVASLSGEHPDVQVAIHTATSGTNLSALLHHEVDVAFLEGPVDARLRAIPLGSTRVGVIAPASWQTRLAASTAEYLAELPWIGRAPGCSYWAVLDELSAQRGLDLRAQHLAPTAAHTYALVAAGMGLALADLDDVEPLLDSGQLIVHPHIAFEVPVWCASLASRAQEPMLKAWENIVRSLHHGRLRYSR